MDVRTRWCTIPSGPGRQLLRRHKRIAKPLAVLQEHYLESFDMVNALVFMIYRRGVLLESVQVLMSIAATIEPFPSLFSVVLGWM